ncbi:MAG: DUF1425 domain-containing protein [Pedosphaera sp.]|nr:DUF1425 domain-containing protein [Pedosphaera sp.]
MKSYYSVLAILALSAALVTGCRSSGGASPPVNTTKFDLENQANFVLLDKATQRSVTSSGIQVRPLEDGRLEIAANIRNRESRRIQVQVNCEFKDDQGFTVDDTPFQTLILSENEQKTIRFVSMNNKAKKFTVRVQQAR